MNRPDFATHKKSGEVWGLQPLFNTPNWNIRNIKPRSWN